MLRQKEKEVMSLQLTIHRLEQKVKEQDITLAEQKQTIRALRKTIQQDLKIIKTMATQKEKELEATSQHSRSSYQEKSPTIKAPSSGHLLPDEDDDDEEDSESQLYESPLKHINARVTGPLPVSPPKASSPVKKSSSPPQPRKTGEPLAAPPIMGLRRRSGRKAMVSRSSPSHNSDHSVDQSIPEGREVSSVHDFEVDDDSSVDSQQNSIFAPPQQQRSDYWNDEDLTFANDPTKIFASFRGGLLDIPKSPPPARHDLAKPKLKLKLKLEDRDRQVLRMPSMRSISRTNSDASNATNGNTIAALAAQMHSLPMDLGSEASSVPNTPLSTQPEVFEKAGIPSLTSPLESPPVAGHSKTKCSPSLKEGLHKLPSEVTVRRKEPSSSNVTANYSIETLENAKSSSSTRQEGNNAIHIADAACQDRYGDPGTYTGTILVSEGLPHGKGIMNYESGRVYDGEWVQGHWNGKGKLLNPNGDTYEGDFVFDARHGQGVYKWDNGDVYVGSFSQDKRHGKGKFSFHNGNVYEGEFNDGMFEGFGKYTFSGGQYEGEWKQGRYDGKGELRYASGGKYKGEFRNSVAHGFGTEVKEDGKTRRGVWENGEPVDYFERN
jgi:hypothetical protein